jgi:aspartate/methionine/tyrosine aminotransferase
MVEDTYEFCEQLVRVAGIMLVPSRIFQYGDHHVRIGFGKENLHQVIEHFADYLGQHFG